MLDGCGIETIPDAAERHSASTSRSMLDDCGIETALRDDYVRGKLSRSMLDGCGIETPALLSSARTPFVAIDARWLWDRDAQQRPAPPPQSSTWRSMLDGCGIETALIGAQNTACPDARWAVESIRDRCSVALERETGARDAASCSKALSRSMLRCFGAETVRHCRDRCSVALERRPCRYVTSRRDRCSTTF